MKSRLFACLILVLVCNHKSQAQYKDLEGVFFGKVIALGVGGSVHSFKDKSIGTVFSVTPLTYSVILDNKRFTSMRLGLYQKFKSTFSGNDGITDYSQTADYKLIEIEVAYKVALTREGLERPASLFLNFQGGSYIGKINVTDSRWGNLYEDRGGSYLGAGLSFFQRAGSRLIVFAEPVYRVSISNKNYLGENGEKKLSLSGINGLVGLMFLIGKSN